MLTAMAPWEELPFFGLPAEKIVQQGVSGGVLPLITADPMRVVLMISAGPAMTSTSVAWASLSNTPVANQGYAITVNNPLILRAKDDPQLCQAAWFSNLSPGVGLVIQSVSLSKWPNLPARVERRIKAQYPGLPEQESLRRAATKG